MYEVLDKDTIKSEVLPHLSVAKRGYVSQSDLMEIIQCILYKLKTGCQWHMLTRKGLILSANLLCDGRLEMLAEYEYDGCRNLTRVCDRFGKAIEFAYDGNNRVVHRRNRNGKCYTWDYDGQGRAGQAGGVQGPRRCDGGLRICGGRWPPLGRGLRRRPPPGTALWRAGPAGERDGRTRAVREVRV